ncbi:DUF5133 domain-containing protein [Streptomyces viridochromogenes]|uniref:DUF5133 domain-containing protein n=1 Tax=Streptomyces viridochromogenes TaxID=1938 RepID=UPI000D10752B
MDEGRAHPAGSPARLHRSPSGPAAPRSCAASRQIPPQRLHSTAHPSLLRELVERCETLRRRLASDSGADTRRQFEDVSYIHAVCGHRHACMPRRAIG